MSSQSILSWVKRSSSRPQPHQSQPDCKDQSRTDLLVHSRVPSSSNSAIGESSYDHEFIDGTAAVQSAGISSVAQSIATCSHAVKSAQQESGLIPDCSASHSFQTFPVGTSENSSVRFVRHGITSTRGFTIKNVATMFFVFTTW